VSIRTLRSREIYRNRWMRVREDDIARADGTPGLYGVVEKANFAVIVPLDGERLQLVGQFRYPVGERFWEFPQGADEDRPDIEPELLARAELEQETGLRARYWRRLGFFYPAYGMTTHGCHAFVASEFEAGERRPEVEEQDMETATVTVAEFERMIRANEIRDAVTLSAWLLYRMNPSARDSTGR
jgi:8-oxo-dGTP pyrophosphatase MutT (NUDIX family)